MLLNRASSRAKASLKLLQEENRAFGKSTKLIPIACDLMSFASVKKASKDVHRQLRTANQEGLDVLINNAGIAYFPAILTEDGFDVQMQVNYLSHFLLTKLLLPQLQIAADKRGEARVVHHSSLSRILFSFDAAYVKCFKSAKIPSAESTATAMNGELGGDGPYHLMKRYAQSKIAVSLFSLELSERLSTSSKPTKGTILAVIADPGLSATGIVNKLKAEAKQAGFLFKLFRSAFFFIGNWFTPVQSAQDGSMSLIAASFGKDVKSGDFLAPSKLIFGTPTKVLKSGTSNGCLFRERTITNETDRKLLWMLSEESIGMKFQLEKEESASQS